LAFDKSIRLDSGDSEGHLVSQFTVLAFHCGPHNDERSSADGYTNIVELEAFDKNSDNSLHLGYSKAVTDTRARAAEEGHPDNAVSVK